MRILYIDHYVGSLSHGMEFRPYYLAREWVRMGHEVIMVGASFAHVRSRQPQVAEDVTEELIDGIRYVWLRTRTYEGNGVARTLNMLDFVRALRRERGRFVAARPDVVIASSTYPWDIYPARAIAKRAKARLIFEVHDLWPMSPMEIGGMSRWHPFIMAVQHGEDYACRHADAIVSILPHADRHLLTRGMAASKFFHVPNGIDFSEWESNHQPDLPVIALARKLRAEGRFVVGYAGSHSPGNALDTLLDVAAQLKEDPVSFIMVGDGPSKAALVERAQGQGLDVHFTPAVGKRDVPAVLREFDALYYGLIPSPLYRYGISANKLFDYMAAGRPVIQSNNASNDLVTEADCGRSVGPGDVQGIVQAIRGLQAMSPAERGTLGRNGQNYVKANHDHRVLAERFAKVFAAPGRTVPQRSEALGHLPSAPSTAPRLSEEPRKAQRQSIPERH